MIRLVILLASVGLVASGCGSSGTKATGPSPSPASSTADAVEKDFSISVSPAQLRAGQVTFTIVNNGPSTHEFVVFKTALAADALPLTKDGQVDEKGAGVTHIDEKEDIAPNSTVTFTFAAPAAHYIAVCNLPGHYKLGMRAAFTTA